jgi:hypothetical protein
MNKMFLLLAVLMIVPAAVLATDDINVTLVSPANSSNLIATERSYNFDVNSTLNATNCTIFFNNVSEKSDSALDNGVHSLTVNMPVGSYVWNVGCITPSGSMNSTGYLLTVYNPITDLSNTGIYLLITELAAFFVVGTLDFMLQRNGSNREWIDKIYMVLGVVVILTIILIFL